MFTLQEMRTRSFAVLSARKTARQTSARGLNCTILSWKTCVVHRDDNGSSEEEMTLDSNLRNAGYQPFISDGFVSAIGNYAPPRPVKILRDTGESQSLMRESILPQSERVFLYGKSEPHSKFVPAYCYKDLGVVLKCLFKWFIWSLSWYLDWFLWAYNLLFQWKGFVLSLGMI